MIRSLLFLLFPGWMTRRAMRKALWTAFQTAAVNQHLAGKPIQFSAQEFDTIGWLWSERKRLEREVDRFVALCGGVNRRNAELMAALQREVRK